MRYQVISCRRSSGNQDGGTQACNICSGILRRRASQGKNGAEITGLPAPDETALFVQVISCSSCRGILRLDPDAVPGDQLQQLPGILRLDPDAVPGDQLQQLPEILRKPGWSSCT